MFWRKNKKNKFYILGEENPNRDRLAEWQITHDLQVMLDIL